MHQELVHPAISGEIIGTKALARQAVKQGLDAHACLRGALISGIQPAGSSAGSGEYILLESLKSADAEGSALRGHEPAQAGDQKREVVGLVVPCKIETDQGES